MVMIPTPTINVAYGIVVQDESQRAKATGVTNLEIGTNVVGYNTGHKLKGHTRDNYYKLVGYPTDYKPKRKSFARNTAAAHNVQLDVTQGSEEQKEHKDISPGNGNDIYSGKVKGIGRLEHDLYVLNLVIQGNLTGDLGLHDISSSLVVNRINGILWHGRLGHVHVDTMKRFHMFNNARIIDVLIIGMYALRQNKADCLFLIVAIKVMFLKNLFMQIYGGPLRTDNGGEFINSQLKELLSSACITHQSRCPYTPQQNGVIERRHTYILDTARALKFQANLPLRFWGECVVTAMYPINRIPSRALGANLKKQENFSLNAMHAVLLGYSPHSLSVPFDSEDLYIPTISSYETPAKTDTSTAASPISSPASSSQSPVPSSPPMVHTEAAVLSTVRHSTGVSRPSIWMSDYVCLEAYSAEVEPRNFIEAAQDPQWVAAMQQEIQALEDNQTLSLV
ncbi:uncharacterized protein [Nicotiana tomentosiformis]|uniref:uncharacterized protein n=1 Tax=Nicotiana tomentosiformis TaxID=4098 RepID=UPI00388CC56D